ncbi:MAG: hypothetical protein KDF59_12390 [Nitrosomonas sp.]|nr:hypothetical protein [Nitrosomonas sp.]
MTTQQNQPIDLTQLAAAIANAMVPLDKRLWDTKQCAAYLNKSQPAFLQRYAPLPSFPKCVRLPHMEKGKSHPQWIAQEVIDWAMKHQEKR